MSRKRRVFDIDMPDATPASDGPRIGTVGADVPRRGPMASAIAENAGALSARAEAEARIRAENDALAHEYVANKRAGLVIQMIPLDDVVTEALVRDRNPGFDDDLPELVASIRDVGLSNPIRVEEREDGKYELIQGYRRLSAYRALCDEAGEAWARIPAGLLPRGEGIAGLYRRMVDENLIRKDLSFAEMALTAQAYAADPETTPQNVDEAVKEVFKSASYQKRSYIRSFARLMDLIGHLLDYPHEVPRNLGLSLLKQLEDDTTLVNDIAEKLDGWENRSIQDELGVLREFVAVSPGDDEVGKPLAPKYEKVAGQGAGRRPRTTFELSHAGSRVKCTAGVGQLTLKLDRDLTSVERQKLERGIARFLDALG
jgi:ParB family transcriptional regulator, chromosome partitioning protein